MIGSAHHELAKWFSSFLQPVLDLFSGHFIKDSFTFTETIQQLHLDPKATFLCSFDISSQFTNILLAETIPICADTLYNRELTPPTIPKALFIELLAAVTSSAEFSFTNIMCKQIGGVAMDSPLSQHLPIYSLNTKRRNCFGETTNPSRTCATLMTTLPSSRGNLTVTAYFRD